MYVEGEDWEETTDECTPHGHNWCYPLAAVPWYILGTIKALVEQCFLRCSTVDFFSHHFLFYFQCVVKWFASIILQCFTFFVLLFSSSSSHMSKAKARSAQV